MKRQRRQVEKPDSRAGINGLLNLIDSQNQLQQDLQKRIEEAKGTLSKNSEQLENQKEKYAKLVRVA